jgi:stearoyl-CoA desaturase (Delta-9 desaturase)
MQTTPTQIIPRPAALGAKALRACRIAFSLSPLIAVHLALLAIPFIEFSWWYLLWMVVLTRIAGLGVSAGLHRYFSHRSFKTTRWFQFLLGAAGCTALQKGPLWWAVHHRLHHRHSDEPGDPHSPVQDGFIYGHVGWLFARDLMHPDETVVHDLTKHPEIVWLDRLWMIPGLLLAGACYALGGWGGLVYGYCLSVVFVFQVTFSVNSFGHLFGPQRFKTGDGSRNNFVLGMLAMGDGWHNNHHRAPSSVRHGFAWYEHDVSYRFIRILKRLGLAWDLKEPAPELLTLPAQYTEESSLPLQHAVEQ